MTVDRSVNSGWSGGGREKGRDGGCLERLWGKGWHLSHHPWSLGHHSFKTPAGAHLLLSVLPFPPTPTLALINFHNPGALLRDSLDDTGLGFHGGTYTDKRTDPEQYWGEKFTTVGEIRALAGSWWCGGSPLLSLTSGALPNPI